ncbi:MAG: translation elongation factor Ts [Sphaerochaetaceae bacterium]|nr:elongation factor Ts [Spirochaetales bacterium]
MEITADIVKKLRDATGAGMMDCKKALVKAEGDFAQAEKLLKEMGLAAVAKRSGRATNNGCAFVKKSAAKAVMLELVCETDFVARNEDFIALGNQLCQDVLDHGYTEIVPELELKVKELMATIKENMALRRFHVFDVPSNGYVSHYIHGEGTMGTVVVLQAEDPSVFKNEQVVAFANDLALHVAAFNPLYLSSKHVDEAYLKEQTEIFTAQTLSLGKPEKVVAGIVQGKMNKHLSEVCFLQQPFVKDDSQSVEKVMQALSKEVGSNLSIGSYLCYKVGVED